MTWRKVIFDLIILSLGLSVVKPSDIFKPTLISEKCKCGQTAYLFSPRIVGGYILKPKNHPFLALLQIDDVFVCGGTIINERYVLTAAHCIKHSNKEEHKYEVRLGAHGRLFPNQKREQLISIDDIIIHEKFQTYKNGEMDNDIALLKLNKTISYTDVIQPVCLPANESAVYQYWKAFVQGWGKTEAKVFSHRPKETRLNVLTQFECLSSKAVMKGDPSTKICAEELYTDACTGDSGGPLYIKDSAAVTLIGVVSSGFGCADGVPGVYTAVLPYVPWILNHTAEAVYCTN